MKCFKMWIIVAVIIVSLRLSVQAQAPPHSHGINFSPYTNFPVQDPPPKPPDDVNETTIDNLLSIIQPHTSWIRTFGAESGLEEIPEIARSKGLKVAMGAFLGPDATVNDKQIDNLIAKAKVGFVDIAVVGNETQVFGALDEAQLVQYLKEVRQRLDDEGLMGIPVTTAEPFGTFVNEQNGSIFFADGSLKKKDIIANVDVVFLNIYPFFEDGIQITEAVNKLEDLYQAAVYSINAAFPDENKTVVISETGWPSGGDPPGSGGVPSLENAIQYFNESTHWAEDNGVDLFYFEAFDEEWKGPCQYEQHFGIWTSNGQLKTLDILDQLGDMNGDDSITLSDVPLFIQALTDRAAYDANGFASPIGILVNADVNGDVNQDGCFDLGDLGPFSALLGGPASTQAVPEPTTIVLTIILLMGIAIRQRRESILALIVAR